jgi:DNA-binding transcriptional ArsR family regulator
MRPPQNRQSRLLQPLDEILGTQANVRLLRVLALRHHSLTAGELARSAVLGRTSIYPVLRQLERAGIVEFVGAGAQRLVQLRDQYPLSRILAAKRNTSISGLLAQEIAHLISQDDASRREVRR